MGGGNNQWWSSIAVVLVLAPGCFCFFSFKAIDIDIDIDGGWCRVGRKAPTDLFLDIFVVVASSTY